MEFQEIEGTKISVLRLPSSISWRERMDETCKFLDEFGPDWLSLQFVPFGFNQKGLCFGLGGRLASLTGRRSWHIMFHELWVGTEVGCSLKMAWWGKLQRRITASMLMSLAPKVVHTQTRLYQVQLEELGFSASCLPLFSNFPVAKEFKISSINRGRNGEELSFVVFGSLHPGAPVEAFINELNEYEKKHQISIKITFIGSSGTELKNWLNILQGKNIETIVLGQHPSEYVSQVLSNGDFGISTTPYVLAKKSSAIATMLEHELPILCVQRKLQIKGFTDQPDQQMVSQYEIGWLEKLLTKDKASNQKNDLNTIGTKFLSNLSSNGEGEIS